MVSANQWIFQDRKIKELTTEMARLGALRVLRV